MIVPTPQELRLMSPSARKASYSSAFSIVIAWTQRRAWWVIKSSIVQKAVLVLASRLSMVLIIPTVLGPMR
jgi:hypothetical protein